MKNKLINNILFISFILFFLSNNLVFSLELTDIQDTLSKHFNYSLNKNEGTTTFRSLLIPLGGRSESLGTAFTGLCDDVSFIDYNPAASSILKKTELAVFHNSWISDSAMDSIIGTTRKSNLGMGFKLNCFYVPFNEYDFFGNQVASNYYSESTAVFNLSYNFLAGYYFKGIALGVNTKVSWKSIPDYTDNNTNEIIPNSGLSQSSLGLMADLGMILQFNLFKYYDSRDTNFKIGISALNLGTAFTNWTNGNIKLDDPLSSVIQVGISYKFVEPLIFVAEFKQPINLLKFNEYHLFSIAGGLEYQINDLFSIAAGLCIKGGNPKISLGSDIEINKIRFSINYTLDLTSSLNPLNRISLSAKINFGDKGRKVLQDKIDNLYKEGISFYAKGEYENAIKIWNDVLLLDKRFDPAIDGIKSATLQLLMFQKLVNMQHFEEKEEISDQNLE